MRQQTPSAFPRPPRGTLTLPHSPRSVLWLERSCRNFSRRVFSRTVMGGAPEAFWSEIRATRGMTGRRGRDCCFCRGLRTQDSSARTRCCSELGQEVPPLQPHLAPPATARHCSSTLLFLSTTEQHRSNALAVHRHLLWLFHHFPPFLPPCLPPVSRHLLQVDQTSLCTWVGHRRQGRTDLQICSTLQ